MTLQKQRFRGFDWHRWRHCRSGWYKNYLRRRSLSIFGFRIRIVVRIVPIAANKHPSAAAESPAMRKIRPATNTAPSTRAQGRRSAMNARRKRQCGAALTARGRSQKKNCEQSKSSGDDTFDHRVVRYSLTQRSRQDCQPNPEGADYPEKSIEQRLV